MIEDKIKELIEDTLNDIGLELVKVSFHGGERKNLEVLIDKLDGKKVNIEDCRNASKNISAILDVEDVIQDKYFLEVSSAGIERPLVKFQDFERFIGRDVKIRLKEPRNNNTNFKGKLLDASNDNIFIKSKNITLEFAYNDIKSANLILTDEMFKQLLTKKTTKGD